MGKNTAVKKYSEWFPVYRSSCGNCFCSVMESLVQVFTSKKVKFIVENFNALWAAHKSASSYLCSLMQRSMGLLRQRIIHAQWWNTFSTNTPLSQDWIISNDPRGEKTYLYFQQLFFNIYHISYYYLSLPPKCREIPGTIEHDRQMQESNNILTGLLWVAQKYICIWN